MIWTRTPCRLSFLGGGTDLPAFFEREEGCVLSATINRYVYVGLRQSHDSSHRMRHEGTEVVRALPELKNAILREVLMHYETHVNPQTSPQTAPQATPQATRQIDLQLDHQLGCDSDRPSACLSDRSLGPQGRSQMSRPLLGLGQNATQRACEAGQSIEQADTLGVAKNDKQNRHESDQAGHQTQRDSIRFAWDVTSISDVPAGTGLGSSSSFTVGLIHAVRRYLKLPVSPVALAQEAIDTEVVRVASAAGQQDQYCAALGGFLFLKFQPSGEVIVERVRIPTSTMAELSASTILLYTGITRSASEVLGRRRDNTENKRVELREMMRLAQRLKSLLEEGGAIARAGELMHEGWQLKKQLAHGISNSSIDEWYERSRRAGAWGGKLMGAGGGGYLMLFVPPERRDSVLSELRELEPVPFAFEANGSASIDW